MSAPQRTAVLVDDDPFQLRLLGLLLDQAGWGRQHAFTDAEQALAQMPSLAPDLLVCDLQMPGMDGVELLRHLGQQGFAGGVVLVSGEDTRILGTAERLARHHGLNVLGAVAKPVSFKALEALLRPAQPAAQPAPRAALGEYSADDLLLALQRGELCAHYQPKVEMASGRWIGVEALARWQHPSQGLVYPDVFIPLAEEAGMIGALTDALLRDAVLPLMRRRRERGAPIQVAVNFSMAMLNDARLPDRLQAQLDAAGVASAHLVLEVTESRLMQDVRTALDILARMRLKRFSLSIDDFGTGHSSLAQLRDVPFGELKVDRSFVHGAHSRPELQALLQASLQMARQLGMKTVAEGIEDEADWRFLRSLGCDVAQGYFIARPMPAEALDAWAEDWARRCAPLVD